MGFKLMREVRLRNEPRTARQQDRIRRRRTTGRHQQYNRRPPIPDGGNEMKAVEHGI
jgi:hypothetical protein